MSVPATAAEAKRVVSIHQPNYLPWLGFLAKIACSDVFILLDDVQYNKRTWHHRSRYSTPDGLKYLSLSVQSKGTWENKTPIKDVNLSDVPSTPKHFATLRHRYGKSPGWPLLAERLEAVLNTNHEKMIDASWATIQLTMEIFNVKPEIHFSSALPHEGAKGDLMLSLTRAVEGDYYLSGTGAKEYLEPQVFADAGVGVGFQEFSHPQWPQRTGDHPFEAAAFSLEWFLEDPENAARDFHAHLAATNQEQPPRCIDNA